jgi:hypothetical protein
MDEEIPDHLHVCYCGTIIEELFFSACLLLAITTSDTNIMCQISINIYLDSANINQTIYNHYAQGVLEFLKGIDEHMRVRT